MKSEKRLVVLGLNHRTAPVEIREKFSIPQEKIMMVLANLEEVSGIREAVVLSTCNRSEVYAVVEQAGGFIPCGEGVALADRGAAG